MNKNKYTYHLCFEWQEPSTKPRMRDRRWKSQMGYRLWKAKIRLADLGIRFSESYYKGDTRVRYEDLDSFRARRRKAVQS